MQEPAENSRTCWNSSIQDRISRIGEFNEFNKVWPGLTKFDIRYMPWESRHHKLSRNTKFFQTRHRELDQSKAGKTKKISQSVGKLPTTAIRCTTFAHRVFPILTMSFRKSCAFSKRATSSTTRFFWLVKSLSELTGIRAEKLGKTILNAKNSLTALLPGAAVFNKQVRIT